MRYVSLSASSLPIGSGVTESAAKTVVGRRAKNSGQRWSVAGGQEVIQFHRRAGDPLIHPASGHMAPLRL